MSLVEDEPVIFGDSDAAEELNRFLNLGQKSKKVAREAEVINGEGKTDKELINFLLYGEKPNE